jgi:CRISPR-associated protein Csm4
MGADETEVESYIPSDTLFSALISALAGAGDDKGIHTLIEEEPVMSSIFPFVREELLLPRPQAAADRAEGAAGIQERSAAKKVKKSSFVPRHLFDEIVSGRGLTYLDVSNIVEDYRYAVLKMKPQVRLWTGAESEPYYVAALHFYRDCGLWFMVDGSESVITAVTKAVSLLADQGIGGERSCGYGRFTFTVEKPPVWLQEKIPETASETGKKLILMSRATPRADEIEAVAESSMGYSLIQSRGWMTSPDGQSYLRLPVWQFTEGSVFGAQFRGGLMDVTPSDVFNEYTVYRNCRAFWLASDS